LGRQDQRAPPERLAPTVIRDQQGQAGHLAQPEQLVRLEPQAQMALMALLGLKAPQDKACFPAASA
jgi:hypothetical protein